jgi:hypothetical protein
MSGDNKVFDVRILIVIKSRPHQIFNIRIGRSDSGVDQFGSFESKNLMRILTSKFLMSRF